MPAPTYIISKVADPIFAVFIGLSSAATRINREEKEKGMTTAETVASGKRRLAGLAEQMFPARSQPIPTQEQLQNTAELRNERRKVAGLPHDQTKR